MSPTKGASRGPRTPPDRRPNPVDELARTIEALLVVAVAAALRATSSPRRAATTPSASATRSSCSRERYREGRSGIVLEHVAGGWAFRASREAAEACARLFERPVERGLIAGGARDARDRRLPRAVHPARHRADPRRQRRRRRRRAASSAACSPKRAATQEFGAVRYATTPLFERVFGLESLAELPRLDDLGADVTEIRRAPRGGGGEATGVGEPASGREGTSSPAR